MAVLTAEQLASLRQGFEHEGNYGPWLKADLNAAFQAIEDWWEATTAARNGVITAATAPGLLPDSTTKALGKQWQQHKTGQGG